MRFLDHPKRLMVLVGPTAVGKTETALQLAERLNGEVVSADSRLFYRGMDIGTAKPTAEERQRVVHHLIDVADPGQTWSLALFQAAAAAAIADIQQRGCLPLLVGGTGQYIRAVVEAWQPPKISPNLALRSALEAWAMQIGAVALHDRLRRLDAEAAAHIDPNNLRRTVRALEVIFTTGERFSVQRRRTVSPYAVLQLGLNRPRSVLYERVDRRIGQMLADGLVDEVRALLASGCSSDWPPFSAIGYREIGAYLAGQMTLDEAVAQMKRLTRQFVRRQANWFKQADPSIHWFAAGPEVVDEMVDFILNAEVDDGDTQTLA
jgi:tRNA dimethylallyltransferase